MDLRFSCLYNCSREQEEAVVVAAVESAVVAAVGGGGEKHRQRFSLVSSRKLTSKLFPASRRSSGGS